MNTQLDYDFESLAGENLYKVLEPLPGTAPHVFIARVGYRNGDNLIGLCKPYERFAFHPNVPCKGRDGLLTTTGDVFNAKRAAQ